MTNVHIVTYIHIHVYVETIQHDVLGPWSNLLYWNTNMWPAIFGAVSDNKICHYDKYDVVLTLSNQYQFTLFVFVLIAGMFHRKGDVCHITVKFCSHDPWQS